MCVSVRGARKAKTDIKVKQREYFLPTALPPRPIKADLIMVRLTFKAFCLHCHTIDYLIQIPYHFSALLSLYDFFME